MTFIVELELLVVGMFSGYYFLPKLSGIHFYKLTSTFNISWK